MKLTIKDRLGFTLLFPKTGGLLEQLTVKSINNKISITKDEIEKCEFKQEGEQVTWNTTKDEGKEVEFTESELVFLKGCIDKLDKDKLITQDILDLCLLIRGK